MPLSQAKFNSPEPTTYGPPLQSTLGMCLPLFKTGETVWLKNASSAKQAGARWLTGKNPLSKKLRELGNLWSTSRTFYLTLDSVAWATSCAVHSALSAMPSFK